MRFASALATAFALFPVSALAQQPHWTNASEWGMRVTPAIIADQPWRVRVGGNGGVVSRADDVDPDNDEDIQALAGQLAISWKPPIATLRGFELVFAGASTYVTAADPQPDPAEKPTWKANLGDAFVGARYVHATAGPFAVGGEAGALIYGQVSPDAGTSLQILADHPIGFVARGLASARAGDALFSANVGVIADGSYGLWKAIAEEECLYQQRASASADWSNVACQNGQPVFTEPMTRLAPPNEDLRTAYGIYGESSNLTRFAFGVAASKPIPNQRSLIPFLELTGEMNGGELVARATPGIAFQRDRVHVIASADLRLSPAPFSETALLASPGEPDARVNVGLQLALGPSLGPRPRFADRTPVPRATPAANVITVTVTETGTGRRLAGVRVSPFDSQSKEREGAAKVTDGEGAAVFERADLPPGGHFRAASREWRAWPAVQIPTSPTNVAQLVAWPAATFVPVRIELRNERNQPVVGRPVRVSIAPSLGGAAITRTIRSGSYQEEIPAGDWKITLACDCAQNEVTVHEGPLTPLATPVWLVGDPNKMLTFDLTQPAVPTTSAPPPAVDPMRTLFDTDLAELKPTDELRRVAGLLRANDGLRAELTVNVKRGSDPLFAETLAKARADALAGFFQREGFGSNRVKIDINLKATEDSVSVVWR